MQLADLAHRHDIIAIGEAHIDPSITNALIVEARALYQAGVRHVILEMKDTAAFSAVRRNRPIPASCTDPGYGIGVDGFLTAYGQFDVTLAMTHAGIEVHAGDNIRADYQQRPLAEQTLSGADVNGMPNREMSHKAAHLAGSGKVIIVVGHDHLFSGNYKSFGIHERLTAMNLNHAVVAQTGGTTYRAAPPSFTDDYAQLALTKSNVYAYNTPPAALPAEAGYLVHTGKTNEVFQMFDNRDAFGCYLRGLTCVRRSWFEKARDNFQQGANLCDVRQLVDAARMSLFLGDFAAARADITTAARLNVQTAQALQLPYGNAIAAAERAMGQRPERTFGIDGIGL